MARTNDEILATVEEQGVEFVNLQFTDIVGMVKNVTIPVRQLPDCLDHGVWFDGSSIEGFARIAESDMFLIPDLETYAVIPWDQAAGYPTARMICDVYTPDGKPFAGDPRHILRTAVAQAAREGMVYNVGPELEFFLFKPAASLRADVVDHALARWPRSRSRLRPRITRWRSGNTRSISSMGRRCAPPTTP
jgi:glutamine synthetase